jgi:hypothetical protein
MIPATVARGHGVASGTGGDPRFPEGTLRLQFPLFERSGLDLGGMHPGTINLDIAPARYEIVRAKLTLTNIHWHPDCPAETFSFFDCQIELAGLTTRALIYYPHPETKPEHFQSPSVLEIIAPKIENLSYGQTVRVSTDPTQIRLYTD